jgi:hypothetical protein
MLMTLYSAFALLVPQYFENFVFDVTQKKGSKRKHGDPFERACLFHCSSETRRK